MNQLRGGKSLSKSKDKNQKRLTKKRADYEEKKFVFRWRKQNQVKTNVSIRNLLQSKKNKHVHVTQKK